MATMRMFSVAFRVVATPNLSNKQDLRSLVRMKTINVPTHFVEMFLSQQLRVSQRRVK